MFPVHFDQIWPNTWFDAIGDIFALLVMTHQIIDLFKTVQIQKELRNFWPLHENV